MKITRVHSVAAIQPIQRAQQSHFNYYIAQYRQISTCIELISCVFVHQKLTNILKKKKQFGTTKMAKIRNKVARCAAKVGKNVEVQKIFVGEQMGTHLQT